MCVCVKTSDTRITVPSDFLSSFQGICHQSASLALLLKIYTHLAELKKKVLSAIGKGGSRREGKKF